ncbi:MAG: RMD1 family protein [Hyphomicrobiaceae bacterium]|nr:RMD1 family protein [Hyphomicrobiaceae bacterium]
MPTPTLPGEFTVRALLLGESLDLKGLERSDSYAQSPLAFRAGAAGTAMLFKSGAAVFFNLTPVEEEELIRGLDRRIVGPLPNAEREIETARIVARGEDELVSSMGTLQVRSAEADRLLLIAEALAVSVALAHDERRIAGAFERVEPVAATLMERKLPSGPQSALLEQIGEALLIQKRLAGRADLDEKPDVLWDHPELERFWVRLVDEYDLPARARAIERKLTVIRETADTIRDLITTRTSFRLEWYIIALIALEIVIGLYDRFFK